MRQKQMAASEIGATTELVPGCYPPGMDVNQRRHPGCCESVPSKLLPGPLGSVLPTPLTFGVYVTRAYFWFPRWLKLFLPLPRGLCPCRFHSVAQPSFRNPRPDLALCLPLREAFPAGPPHSLVSHQPVLPLLPALLMILRAWALQQAAWAPVSGLPFSWLGNLRQVI